MLNFGPPMRFPSPLLPARFLKRYKRFFADVVLEDGAEITVHCPNPGAMMGLMTPGARVWISKATGAKRKLAHTLELMEADGDLVGINTLLPNRIVGQALAAKALPPFADYPVLRREVPYGEGSRVDFLLERPDGTRCFLEVKNVHLKRRPGLAEFPDCVTARGARHMEELGAMVAQGQRAAVLFLVQRENCNQMAIASDLDPGYAAAFEKARARGVEAFAYACALSPEAIEITHPLPVVEGLPICC